MLKYCILKWGDIEGGFVLLPSFIIAKFLIIRGCFGKSLIAILKSPLICRSTSTNLPNGTAPKKP